MNSFVCQNCGNHLADWDVAIDKLDGKSLPRKFNRVYCRSCGKTHVSDGKGMDILEVEFTWSKIT